MLQWLFDASDFVTRSNCGKWTPWLAWTFQISNLVIAVAYFWMPICIMRLWKHRRAEVHKPWILVCFAAFIVLCGATHTAEIAVFYWPGYHLYTTLLALTAAVSAATACVLPGVITYAIKLPSREYVHALNNQLELRNLEASVAIAELTKLKENLEARVMELQGIIERGERRQTMLDRTSEILAVVRGAS